MAQLELVASDEQMATFRQELKAAQLEVKAGRSLNQDGRSAQRWRAWRPESGGRADQETAKDGDQPPENNQKSPKKDRGKGKKGGKKGYRW